MLGPITTNATSGLRLLDLLGIRMNKGVLGVRLVHLLVSPRLKMVLNRKLGSVGIAVILSVS